MVVDVVVPSGCSWGEHLIYICCVLAENPATIQESGTRDDHAHLSGGGGDGYLLVAFVQALLPSSFSYSTWCVPVLPSETFLR